MRQALAALTALTLLALGLVFLTWPAQSADLTFTCSGAFKPFDDPAPPRTISNQTLFIDLDSKTVWGVIGPYDIDEISDKLVKFSIGTRDKGAYSEGFFDRYSGEVQATVYGNGNLVSGGYHLTCKPAKPPF